MQMKKNILVFPCGSEIALEIYRALENSLHFKLIGANSVNDHGKFVFKNYIDNIPFIGEEKFLDSIKKIVIDNEIDAIYPATDAVIEIFKSNEEYLGCKVIASSAVTTQICLSKLKTYRVLNGIVKVPKTYNNIEKIKSYPIFVKPDIGYGSRGAKKIHNKNELLVHLQEYPLSVICEYLPGSEYTVDCFTDKNGKLLVSIPRERCRIMNGISVNTKPVKTDLEYFNNMANKINDTIKFRGAWFFQVKRNIEKDLILLEIASRFGGSSGLFRGKGINFASMSLFDAFDIPVSVLQNDYDLEMDRALDSVYKLDIEYNEVFVDFDDCIYLEKQFINSDIVAFLFKCINQGVKITLLSKHDDTEGTLEDLLVQLRIRQIFDRIIHILPEDKKCNYVDNRKSIFIDDSFAERKAVKDNCGINVFSLDMIRML